MDQVEVLTEANDYVIFTVLADVVKSLTTSDRRVWGVRVSVNPSRFGVDEAFSVLLRTQDTEGEIGKILVIPRGNGLYWLRVPIKHTGGAAWSELDPQGNTFDAVVQQLLVSLEKRGLVPKPDEPEEKRRDLGFRPPGKGHAS